MNQIYKAHACAGLFFYSVQLLFHDVIALAIVISIKLPDYYEGIKQVLLENSIYHKKLQQELSSQLMLSQTKVKS